jgi:hypothetical protein
MIAALPVCRTPIGAHDRGMAGMPHAHDRGMAGMPHAHDRGMAGMPHAHRRGTRVAPSAGEAWASPLKRP